MTSSNAKHEVAARDLVLGSSSMTTEDLLTILAGRPTTGSIARLRHQGALLGMRIARRGYLYPDFQIDRGRRRVEPVVARVNRTLTRTLEVPEAIRWWLTTPTVSGSVAPAALVQSGRYNEVLVELEQVTTSDSLRLSLESESRVDRHSIVRGMGALLIDLRTS